jgi:hypothetical protein
VKAAAVDRAIREAGHRLACADSFAAPMSVPFASLALVASLAPAPIDAERPYEGPAEVAAPDTVADVEVASDVDTAAPTSAAAATSEITGPDDRVVALPVPEPGPEPRPNVRPVPRILTTMVGWYPGEEAQIRNAKGTVVFTPGLQARAAVGAVSEFSLDDDGNQWAEGAHLYGRIRWRPVLGLGKKQKVAIIGMVDFAGGRWTPQTSGDPVVQEILDEGHPPQRYGMTPVDFRELYVQWTTKYGQLRLGQMSFNWGLGLVANDGNNMDRFGDMKFGDDGIGSIQERILFATRPLARTGGPGKDLVVAIAADLVFRDPVANLLKGDLAGQAILVVRWEPAERPGNWIGVYAAYRNQHSADDGDDIEGDDELEVGVFDFAGQGYRYLRDEFAVLGAFEVATFVGRTTFQKGDFSKQYVLQAAAAVRGYIGNPMSWLLGADAGMATGDADPDDEEVNDFEPAPGYTAGLLMFQYYRGWQSARSQMRAEDPGLVGVPNNGTQYIPTRGTVTNAFYAHPKVRYAFREHFEVWGGPLVAASAVPIVDPYVTRLEGGSAHNSLGGASERRYMGTELDLGLRTRYGLKNLWLMVGLQGGILFPGRAFERRGGGRDNPVYGGWLRFEIRY